MKKFEALNEKIFNVIDNEDTGVLSNSLPYVWGAVIANAENKTTALANAYQSLYAAVNFHSNKEGTPIDDENFLIDIFSDLADNRPIHEIKLAACWLLGVIAADTDDVKEFAQECQELIESAANALSFED